MTIKAYVYTDSTDECVGTISINLNSTSTAEKTWLQDIVKSGYYIEPAANSWIDAIFSGVYTNSNFVDFINTLMSMPAKDCDRIKQIMKYYIQSENCKTIYKAFNDWGCNHLYEKIKKYIYTVEA